MASRGGLPDGHRDLPGRVLVAHRAALAPQRAQGDAGGADQPGRASGWSSTIPNASPTRCSTPAWQALKEAPGFYETLDAFFWMPPPAPPKVPVTIAWGEKDRLLPKRQAVRAGRWAQKRIHLMPGCGHVPMTDDPELVARVILMGARAAN